MHDAKRHLADMRPAQDAGDDLPPVGDLFGSMLADSMQEMADADALDASDALPPDAIDRLRHEAATTLRSAGGHPLPQPFHHAYLTPIGSPAVPSRPGRLDVRY